MATQMTISCDVCGETENVSKQILTLGDAATWEIDLCDDDFMDFLAALEKSVNKFRGRGTTLQAARSAKRSVEGTAPYAAAEGVNLTEVRDWAYSKNIPVSSRGRISGDVIERWKKATGWKAPKG